ncbi:hypothetical protein [uncultured Kriegella sp.]|uniref:hypothetical protein n=1 Tax=uncultured Kriegella sp. TaxID=1798910 RepID=UPI0030DA01E6
MRELKNSDFVIPLSIFIHLGIINGVRYFSTLPAYLDPLNILYHNVLWLAITYFLYRHTTEHTERLSDKFIEPLHLYAIYGLPSFAGFSLKGRTYDSLDYPLFVFTLPCSLLIGSYALFPRLTPLAYILIKAESLGYLFFRQKRQGFMHKAFSNHPFQSLMDGKNNIQIPLIDKLFQKNSIDESPHFINARKPICNAV